MRLSAFEAADLSKPHTNNLLAASRYGATLAAEDAGMVRFQQLVGCRPGELVKITLGMVNRGGEFWTITLSEHKTA